MADPKLRRGGDGGLELVGAPKPHPSEGTYCAVRSAYVPSCASRHAASTHTHTPTHTHTQAITASLVSYLNRRALWTSTAHRLVCPRKRPRPGDSRSSRVASLRPRRAARSGGTTSRGTTSNAPQALARVSRRHGLKRSIATGSLTRPAAPASSASGGRCAMPCEACPDSPVGACVCVPVCVYLCVF